MTTTRPVTTPNLHFAPPCAKPADHHDTPHKDGRLFNAAQKKEPRRALKRNIADKDPSPQRERRLVDGVCAAQRSRMTTPELSMLRERSAPPDGTRAAISRLCRAPRAVPQKAGPRQNRPRQHKVKGQPSAHLTLAYRHITPTSDRGRQRRRTRDQAGLPSDKLPPTTPVCYSVFLMGPGATESLFLQARGGPPVVTSWCLMTHDLPRRDDDTASVVGRR